MRFFVVPMLTVMLFAVPDANAFLHHIARATGGMGNINSGSCNSGAGGLWSNYCSSAQSGYSYGSGFGAYASQIPPAPCHSCGGGSTCGGGSSWWYGGGHSCGHGGCGGGGCASGGCAGGGLSSLGQHLHGLVNKLRCRCCSAGSSWVGGGPLDSYSIAPASGFDGGIDYGYINTCSDGGCGGGCGCDGGSDGGYVGGDAGMTIHSEMPSEGAIISEPTPAASAPIQSPTVEGPFSQGSGAR